MEITHLIIQSKSPSTWIYYESGWKTGKKLIFSGKKDLTFTRIASPLPVFAEIFSWALLERDREREESEREDKIFEIRDQR